MKRFLITVMTLFMVLAIPNDVQAQTTHNLLEVESGGSIRMTTKAPDTPPIHNKTIYKSDFESVIVGNCSQSEGMHTFLEALTVQDSSYILTLSLDNIIESCTHYQVAANITVKADKITWQIGFNLGEVADFDELVLVNWFNSGLSITQILSPFISTTNAPNFYKLRFSLSPP